MLACATRADAQRNPFRMDLGSHRSVSITWTADGPIIADGRPVGSSAVTLTGLLTPTSFVMTGQGQVTVQGRATAVRTWNLTTPDADADDRGGTDTIVVTPSLQGLLAREFDALPADAKARLVANLARLDEERLDDLHANPVAGGRKTGSATVAGIACDVIERGTTRFCVLPDAPSVALRMEGSLQRGGALVATRVQLDAPVPASAFTYPAGRAVVRRTAEDLYSEGGWPVGLYADKHEGESPSSLEALARFVVRYLASAEAAAELEESAPDQ
ncbi:MAG: hypothetical protein ACREMF_06860 [Gemmatimonadales bacterium]